MLYMEAGPSIIVSKKSIWPIKPTKCGLEEPYVTVHSVFVSVVASSNRFQSSDPCDPTSLNSVHGEITLLRFHPCGSIGRRSDSLNSPRHRPWLTPNTVESRKGALDPKGLTPKGS